VDLASWLAPMAGARGRAAFGRLQHELAAAGVVVAPAAPPVDEPSFAPGVGGALGSFSQSQGVPTSLLATSNMATPPPTAGDAARATASPPGGRLAVGLVLGLALAASGAGTAWWLSRRDPPPVGAATAEEPPPVEAPPPEGPDVRPSADAPSVAPLAEAPAEPGSSEPVASAPPPVGSAAPSAAVTARPRPPRTPRPRPPPPPPTSKSIDELIKKGRR
jgi:hypothetical protein